MNLAVGAAFAPGKIQKVTPGSILWLKPMAFRDPFRTMNARLSPEKQGVS
jgi:hypothetical protein